MYRESKARQLAGEVAIPNPDRVPPSNIGPNRAWYNDWRPLEVPALDTFAPTLPVSVVVPCFEAPDKLARTLAGLERQTYPRHLFEVVVVDDGSEPPLTPPSSTLEIRFVRREGSGFTLAAARNVGVRAAAHSILVFLDCDVLPEAEWLASHARWHHVVSDAVTVGRCAYVDMDDFAPTAIRDRAGSLEDLFSGREFDLSWNERFIRNTNGLTSTDDELFQAVVGNNFGIGKAFYESVGGFDESFVRYGWEDTEFAWRAYARGALLVPDEETRAWHQGRWKSNHTSEKDRDRPLSRMKLAHLVPHPDFRSPAPGRIFAIPRHVVTIHTGDEPGHRIAEGVEALLAEPGGDLVVRIEAAAESWPDRMHWLRERYGPDPRVTIATTSTALDDFPSAAFHVHLRGEGGGERDLVQRLVATLGTGAMARMALSGGGVATITRTWALHRSRRTGLPVEALGEVVTATPDDPASPANASPPRRDERHGAVRSVLRKARTVRSARSGAWFLERLIRGVWNRLALGPRSLAPRRATTASSPGPKGRYPRRSEAVHSRVFEPPPPRTRT